MHASMITYGASIPNMTTANTLGPAVAEVLRVERARAQLTIDELADRAGIGRSTLSRLSKGERGINLGHLAAICEVLGIKVSDFMEMIEAVQERLQAEVNQAN